MYTHRSLKFDIAKHTCYIYAILISMINIYSYIYDIYITWTFLHIIDLQSTRYPYVANRSHIMPYIQLSAIRFPVFAYTCSMFNIIYSKKSPTGPTERTPKP